MTPNVNRRTGRDNRDSKELRELKKRIAKLEKVEKEHIEAEKALRQSEAKYRGLFENILEGVYQTRPSGEIMAANPALVSMLGYKSEKELIDKASARTLYVNPEERKRLVRKLKKEGVLRNVEFELKRKDGSTITVLENARVVKHEKGKTYHFEGVLTDITARKETEKKLGRAHEQLEATLNALPDLFFIVDKTGMIYDFRAPDSELLLKKPEEFLHKPIRKVLPSSAVNTIVQAIREASKKGRHHGATYSLEMPKGNYWFELSLSVMGDPKRKDCRYVALVRNITDRKKNQDKLIEQAEQLRKERTSLHEKNITLRQLIEQIGSQRREIQNDLLLDFEKTVLPMLDSLKKRCSQPIRDEIESLSDTIGAVLASDADDFKLKYGRLTSRESEICDYIKNGLSSKEIAERLNISELTAAKHREKIRKKLELTGKRISLATYLRSHI